MNCRRIPKSESHFLLSSHFPSQSVERIFIISCDHRKLVTGIHFRTAAACLHLFPHSTLPDGAQGIAMRRLHTRNPASGTVYHISSKYLRRSVLTTPWRLSGTAHHHCSRLRDGPNMPHNLIRNKQYIHLYPISSSVSILFFHGETIAYAFRSRHDVLCVFVIP